MERTFQLAIAISVVLFFVTLNIFFRDSVHNRVRDIWSQVAGSSSQVTVSTTPTEPPPVEPKPKPRPKSKAQSKVEPEPAVAPEKKEAPVEIPKVEIPLPPFPTAEDLKAGMTRKEMIGKFGAPRFTASWSENGALAEKFIYTRDVQVTAVILRDGQVVVSRTGANDPWARSAWWQTSTAKEKAEGADREGTKVH